MDTLQIVVASMVSVIFCLIPVALVVYAAVVGHKDDADRRRNSRYVYKGCDKYGNPIYLELPKG